MASNNVKELRNYLRKRVIGLHLYKEYAAKYLAENYFEELMPQFLHAKRLLQSVLGFEYDMKNLNMEWGKRNRSKKAQMRTLLEVSVMPLWGFILIVSVVINLILYCAWLMFKRCLYGVDKQKT